MVDPYPLHNHSNSQLDGRTCTTVWHASLMPLTQELEPTSSFSAYNSVLSHYPSLRGSLGLQEMVDMPNLKSLRMLAFAQHMTDNGLENR
jgi:hypothetical protein